MTIEIAPFVIHLPFRLYRIVPVVVVNRAIPGDR